ncbi:MAG: hypothetical protein P8N76_05710 [Pirellulaceae bacterium]|nr:hypothetical protein [Pirellulaceae bacterium]
MRDDTDSWKFEIFMFSGGLLPVALMLTLLSAGARAAEETWWHFCGSNGNGYTTEKSLPLDWNGSQNVVWKTAIHDRGWSSPVIGSNQIWLTTSTRDGQRIFAICVNKDSGKIVWKHRLPRKYSASPV